MNEDEVLTRWWDAREAGHTWRKMVGWRPPRVKWLHAAHANKAINWALQRWKAWLQRFQLEKRLEGGQRLKQGVSLDLFFPNTVEARSA